MVLPKKDRLKPLPMSLVELVYHTYKVLTGEREAMNPKTAQAVGPKDNLQRGVALLIASSFVMFLVLYVLNFIGFQLGRLCGLKKAKSTRLAGAFVEAVYYTCSLACITKCAWDSPWFWPSGWAEVMYDGRIQKIKDLEPYTVPADMKTLYIMETSYYIAGFVWLHIRARKKDHLQMAAHHVFTILLLCLSYTTGYMRIGLVVMFLHNVFDPFMHFAKIFNYNGIEILTNTFFAGVLISFPVTRLYYYPLAIWQAWQGVCNDSKSCPGGVWDKTPVEYSLIGFLIALFPLHVFWYYLILQVLRKTIEGDQKDVRSDDEEEEESTPDAVKDALNKKE